MPWPSAEKPRVCPKAGVEGYVSDVYQGQTLGVISISSPPNAFLHRVTYIKLDNYRHRPTERSYLF